jgi:hypothetical protein
MIEPMAVIDVDLDGAAVSPDSSGGSLAGLSIARLAPADLTLSSLSAAEKRRRCQQTMDWTRRHYRVVAASPPVCAAPQ